MGFPEIVLTVGTALLVAGGFLLRTRWKAHGEVLVWVALAALFVSLACAVFLVRSLPLLAGAAFLGLATATAMALLGVRRGVAAALLASLGAFLIVIGTPRVEGAGDLLLPVGLLVLVGIAAFWKRGWAMGPLLAGGGVFLILTSDLGKILDGSPGELIGIAVVTAAAFVLARLEPRIEGIAWIVSGMVPLLLAVWPVVASGESPATLLTGGVLLAGAAYGAGWGAPRPARWTALSALAGVAFLVLAVSRYGEDRLWWSGLALAGAALFAGMALLTARRQSLAAAAPLAAAAAMLCAFAGTLEIERGWFDVGVALTVPLLVWLFSKLPSPPLRSLTLVLAAFSVLWLGLARKDFGFPDGGLVDFPWLLYAYGVPLAAMLAGVRLARRQGEVRVADRLDWAALGFLLLLVLLSARQIFPETGTAVLVLLGAGIVLAFGTYRARREPGSWETRAATAKVLLVAVFLGATGAEAAWLEGGPLGSSWKVQAPGAKPGDLVRLEIPEEIHARSLGYFGWLSLVAGGRALPYEVDLSPEPVTAVRLQQAPRAEPELRVSRIDLALPPGVRLASLRLTTSSPPFSRKVALVAEPASTLAELDWICRSHPPRPCRLETESLTIPWWPALHERMDWKRTPRLSLVFLDGENPPLPAVDVEIRRWKEALLFNWPQEGTVDLLVGPRGSDGPLSENVDLPEKGPGRPALLAPAEPKSSASAFVLSGAVLLGLLGWRVRERLSRPRALPMVLLMMLAGTSGLSAAEARLYTRPVDVPGKGWVRVPLDLATLRHLGAEGEGVRVFGSDGEEVPSRAETFFQKIERSLIPGAIQTSGWDRQGLVVEVAPASYDQIFLTSGSQDFGATPGVRVEGSDNGQGWHPIGESDLFEVWKDEGWRAGDRRASMLLPSSRYRFVRVLPPHYFQWTEISSLPGRIALWRVERPECRPEADLTVCAIPLPARGQRPLRLTLEMADRRDLGLRLLAAEAGAWRPLVQGVSRPVPGSARHVVPLGADLRLETRSLRLELEAKGAPPRLVRAILLLAQPVAVFEVPRPGRYRLVYGGGEGLELPEDSSVPDDAAWIEAGPESSGELPPLSNRLIRPAVPLRGSFSSSWTVESRGASPGEVVRLEIPDEIYARSQTDLADVRLEVGGRQIPYVRRGLDEPARVVEVRGARLEKSFGGEWQLDITLPQPRMPLTAYRLTAPPDSGTFQEWPSLSLVSADWRPGWHCHPQPLLPCQLNGAARGEEDRAFAPVVTIEDLPIPSFDVSLWRRRDALVFVWPDGGPVRLVTGDREREAPGYDLALIESQILARPWRPASLGPREASIPWPRLPLVVLAAGALLVFLRRKLPVAPPPGQG